MRLADLKKIPNAPLFGGFGGLVEPVSAQRALFNEILQRFDNAPEDLAIMPGTLVSEVLISNTVASQELVWNLRSDQANPTNAIRTTEQRLQSRDAFVCDRIALFFGVQDATKGAGTVVFQQFPNANTQPNGGFTVAGAEAVTTAYNGKLSAIVNTVQYVDAINGGQFIYVDTAQQVSPTTRSAQENSYGYVGLTPAMTVRGSDTSQFTLKLPDPILFNPGAGFNIVARLVLCGMTVQGGAQFQL